MKLLLIFMCISVGLIQASNTNAQNVSLNLRETNNTVGQVLKEIEAQTGYTFFYNTKQVDVNRKVRLSSARGDVFKVLSELFEDTDVNYSVLDKSIILSNNKQAAPQAAVQAVKQDDGKVISGVVKDEKGETLPGVSIKVKGSDAGTFTDIDGNFSLKVKDGQKIVASYIGYTTLETAIGSASTYDIVLKEESVNLDAVVVTALGIKRAEKALSYNVQQIEADAVNTVKSPNFVTSLSGKVAGLDIKSTSAGVGSSARVVMRGVKSVSQNNNVLYVIDGIPITNYAGGSLNDEFSSESGSESISDMNPDDIESISVLNGAAAAALYGSNAANGAILITTKKGVAGKVKLSLSNQTSFMKPFVLPEFQNKYGNAASAYDSWGSELPTASTYDPADFFNTGVTIQNTVSMSTGTDKNQTYVSLSNVTSDGIIPNSMYDRYNATFRNTTSFLNDKMKLDFGFGFVQQKDRNMIAQGEYFNPLTSVYTFPRGEDFTPIRSFERFSEARNIYVQFWPYGDQGMDMQNPYWVTSRNLFEHNKKRYMANATLTYDVTSWLNLMGRVRLDNAYTDHTRKMYATTNALHAGGDNTETSKGYYGANKWNDEQTYADFIASVNKRFNDFSLQANVGTSIEDSRSNRQGISGTLDLANAFYIYAIKNRDQYKISPMFTSWRQQTQSIFANAELGWKSLVYLTLTGRNDWSSTLSGMPQKSFFYPSVGISGVVSDMLKLPEPISYLKIRASWADVGNGIPRQISESYYRYEYTESSYKLNDYMPITKLYPERTRSWEIGMDARFFDNVLKLDASVYRSNTFNQTLQVPVSASTGYKSKYIQTGNVRNQGVEFRLAFTPKWKRFQWESVFTASRNWNKVLDLGRDVQKDGTVVYYDSFTQVSAGTVQIRLTKGGTMGDLYTTTALATDSNGNINIDENNQVFTVSQVEKAGTTLPSWKMGFNNSFAWKNINLSFLISARLGGQVLSRTQAVLDFFGVSKASADLRNAGGKKINNGTIPTETWYKTIGGKQGVYKYYIYDADNVRLQELRLGYNLPASWFNNVMRMQVSLVANNLFMIYNKAPFDPETTSSVDNYYQGIDYFMQPSMRSLGFSVKVDF
jgi:TonB-linked SusC/RagA family outer membrane protein